MKCFRYDNNVFGTRESVDLQVTMFEAATDNIVGTSMYAG
jgi:hypothetical protein